MIGGLFCNISVQAIWGGFSKQLPKRACRSQCQLGPAHPVTARAPSAGTPRSPVGSETPPTSARPHRPAHESCASKFPGSCVSTHAPVARTPPGWYAASQQMRRMGMAQRVEARALRQLQPPEQQRHRREIEYGVNRRCSFDRPIGSHFGCLTCSRTSMVVLLNNDDVSLATRACAESK